MKVHPAPKKRNITFRYDIASSLTLNRQKKLRRLPHIFAKVLELPFHSDADVLVQETSNSLRFVVTTDDDIGDDVRAHTIEIYPGVTKIVVRGTNVLDLSMDELELDVWRFRLPAATRPELASAVYTDGELVVTVPKGDNADEGDGDDQEQTETFLVGIFQSWERGAFLFSILKRNKAAENLAIGKTQKGGPAAVMQSAAAVNQQRGVVGHDGGSTIATEQGVTISEAEVAGHRIITEVVGEEVVGQYVEPGTRMKFPAGAQDRDAITIGEALEATALSAGNKPVNQSDAAAIQAAEIRASGSIHPGGVAATAQSAASRS